MLIVELDGGYHFTDKQQKEDIIRQEWLEKIGYKVIRFSNEEVLFNTEYVVNQIKSRLKTAPLQSSP